MRPEFRVLLREKCVVNPPVEREQALEAIPLVGLFLPKAVELGLGAVASLLKKAGAEETKQVTGAEITSLYQADKDQKLAENASIGCILGIHGDFGGEDAGDERAEDWAVRALKAAGIIPPNLVVRIIFEGRSCGRVNAPPSISRPATSAFANSSVARAQTTATSRR